MGNAIDIGVLICLFGLLSHAWRVWVAAQTLTAPVQRTFSATVKQILLSALLTAGILFVAMLYLLLVHGKQWAWQFASDAWWIPALFFVFDVIVVVWQAVTKPRAGQASGR